MNLSELKTEVRKHQYLEDEGLLNVSLAAMIATSLSYGRPAWMIIIGPSSGGKSQLLRPLSLTNPKFIHRLDDLTENTFLSGMATKADAGPISFLHKVGERGIIVISDLSVIFSKSADTKASILSQFRMIYDGEMIKHVGTKSEPLHWRGRVGILAGATPSVYRTFEEVADMGERFIYYRMKPMDIMRPTQLAAQTTTPEESLDTTLSCLYHDYLKGVVDSMQEKKLPELSDIIRNRIIEIAIFAEKIRTTAHTEWNGDIDDVPVPAMPMRLVKQLMGVVRGMQTMAFVEDREINEAELRSIEWCAYSLANEKKRSVMKILAKLPTGVSASTGAIADKVGLSTDVIRKTLQVLAATGVLERIGSEDGLSWRFANESDKEIVRRLESIDSHETLNSRGISYEDGEETKLALDAGFEELVNEAKRMV
jgi:hypothetical protein